MDEGNIGEMLHGAICARDAKFSRIEIAPDDLIALIERYDALRKAMPTDDEILAADICIRQMSAKVPEKAQYKWRAADWLGRIHWARKP